MKRLDDLDLRKQSDSEWAEEEYISKFEGTWIPFEYREKDDVEQYAIKKWI